MGIISDVSHHKCHIRRITLWISFEKYHITGIMLQVSYLQVSYHRNYIIGIIDII
jgi:hypothetical protein